MKALVIFSGGQDSTTCLYWALQKFDTVYAITFIYGQRHAIELACATQICIDEDVHHEIIQLPFMKQLSDSALLHDRDINKKDDNDLPASFVPNRNQLFITLAHAYAQKIKAYFLVTGVCQTDYSGYPDCRHDFIADTRTASTPIIVEARQSYECGAGILAACPSGDLEPQTNE